MELDGIQVAFGRVVIVEAIDLGLMDVEDSGRSPVIVDQPLDRGAPALPVGIVEVVIHLAGVGLGACIGGFAQHVIDETGILGRKPDQADRCLLYTSDAADERSSVDLGGRRIIKQ